MLFCFGLTPLCLYFDEVINRKCDSHFLKKSSQSHFTRTILWAYYIILDLSTKLVHTNRSYTPHKCDNYVKVIFFTIWEIKASRTHKNHGYFYDKQDLWNSFCFAITTNNDSKKTKEAITKNLLYHIFYKRYNEMS